jgi:hypothetical protein
MTLFKLRSSYCVAQERNIIVNGEWLGFERKWFSTSGRHYKGICLETREQTRGTRTWLSVTQRIYKCLPLQQLVHSLWTLSRKSRKISPISLW